MEWGEGIGVKMKRLETMRSLIASCYDGISWKMRCSRMDPKQVYAIYSKFESEGRFNKPKKKKKEDYKQLTLFDFGLETGE